MKSQRDSLSKENESQNNKGTIIYWGNIEFPDRCAAAHRVINNGKIFRSLGYHVVFLGVSQEPFFEGVRASAYDGDIFYEAYPDTTKRWIQRLFRIDSLLSLAKQYDDLKLIIAYNIPYITLKAIKKAFKNRSVKIAYDCTEWNDYAEGAAVKRIYKKLDAYQIVHRLSKQCRNMIAVSSLIQSQYKRCHTLLLPPLVDIEDSVWRQDRESHPGIFEFCYSAATYDNKDDPGIVIRAFAMLEDPDIRLTVIGLDRAEALRRFPGICDTVESDARIVLTGSLTHSETVRRLMSSDCFVFFRRDIKRNCAGFPTKFVEAYTCSVPVLTNPIGDVGKYAASENSVILTEDISVDQIRDQLQCIRKMSGMTDKKTDDTFDYRQYIGRTEEWINSLC